jgi:type II secretory pathway component PulJ
MEKNNLILPILIALILGAALTIAAQKVMKKVKEKSETSANNQ